MYIFKNRSHYAQPAEKNNQAPTVWEEKVINREITWKSSIDGLHYTVTGDRVNHGDLIVNPEHKATVLFEGLKKNVYKASEDLLTALADAWAARVLLPNGQAYNGCNGATEGPESPQVISNCTKGPYPYF